MLCSNIVTFPPVILDCIFAHVFTPYTTDLKAKTKQNKVDFAGNPSNCIHLYISKISNLPCENRYDTEHIVSYKYN